MACQSGHSYAYLDKHFNSAPVEHFILLVNTGFDPEMHLPGQCITTHPIQRLPWVRPHTTALGNANRLLLPPAQSCPAACLRVPKQWCGGEPMGDTDPIRLAKISWLFKKWACCCQNDLVSLKLLPIFTGQSDIREIIVISQTSKCSVGIVLEIIPFKTELL